MNAFVLSEFFRLLWGTVIHRPYVYAFFVCFLFFSLKHLRAKGTLVFLILAYLVAYWSEFSATRNGFPFGMYVYLDETRVRELWISNIPFWDSLSFVFLSYFSWIVAAATLRPANPDSTLSWPKTALLGGFLMMLLDVVIDPLTLLGDRWFLGKIYYYPYGGNYFGVTLTNFLGWWFVGSVVIFLFTRLRLKRNPLTRSAIWGAFGVYAGVLVFNLVMTAWIQEWPLLMASLIVTIATLSAILWAYRRSGARGVR